MKKLILILFSPLLMKAQSLEDLKGVHNLDDFKKIMIENYYSKVGQLDNGSHVYAYNEKELGIYNEENKTWILRFGKQANNSFGHYNKITNEMKENCNYMFIQELGALEIASYGCDMMEELPERDMPFCFGYGIVEDFGYILILRLNVKEIDGEQKLVMDYAASLF